LGAFKVKNMRIVLWLAIFFPVLLFGQADFSGMAKAMGSGNVDVLGQYFDVQLDISLNGEEQTLDKSRALVFLKQFFAQHTAKGFQVLHQGASRGSDAQYSIGNLSTSGGTFRVYMYVRSVGAKFLIQEIRIDQGG
jgi:hypothetical protein